MDDLIDGAEATELAARHMTEVADSARLRLARHGRMLLAVGARVRVVPTAAHLGYAVVTVSRPNRLHHSISNAVNTRVNAYFVGREYGRVNELTAASLGAVSNYTRAIKSLRRARLVVH